MRENVPPGQCKMQCFFSPLENPSWIYLKKVVTFKLWIKKLPISDKVLKDSGNYY